MLAQTDSGCRVLVLSILFVTGVLLQFLVRSAVDTLLGQAGASLIVSMQPH